MQAAQAAVEAKDEESKKDKKVPALRKRNRSGTVSKKKDELHNFEVVGIDQLGLQNQEAARLARRRSRAISDSFAPQSPMTIRLTNIAPAASSLDVAGPLKISAADDFSVSTPRRTIGDRFK